MKENTSILYVDTKIDLDKTKSKKGIWLDRVANILL